MSIANKLIRAKNDCDDVFNAGRLKPLQNSQYLHPIVKSETICIKDMTDIPHNISIEKSSKNLIPYPYYSGSLTSNGVTFSPTIEGISITGSSSQITTYYVWNNKSGSLELEVKEDMVLSGCPTGGTSTSYKLMARVRKPDGSYSYPQDYGSGTTIEAGNIIEYIYISINADTNMEGLVFKPQLEIGTKATTYTPQITDFDSVKVYKYGLNMFKSYNAESTVGSITVKLSEDGFVETSGEYDASVGLIYLMPPSNFTKIILPPGKYYRYIGEYNGVSDATDIDIMLQCRYMDGSWAGNVSATSYGGREFNKPFYIANLSIQIRKESGVGVRTPVLFNRFPLDISEYEPYVEGQEIIGNSTLNSPNPMTLMTDTPGVVLECQYCRDIDKYINNFTTAIAMSGGN